MKLVTGAKVWGDLCSRGLESITKSQSYFGDLWREVEGFLSLYLGSDYTYIQKSRGFATLPSLGFFSQHPTNLVHTEWRSRLFAKIWENESFKMILFNFLVVLWWESILTLATPGYKWKSISFNTVHLFSLLSYVLGLANYDARSFFFIQVVKFIFVSYFWHPLIIFLM